MPLATLALILATSSPGLLPLPPGIPGLFPPGSLPIPKGLYPQNQSESPHQPPPCPTRTQAHSRSTEDSSKARQSQGVVVEEGLA